MKIHPQALDCIYLQSSYTVFQKHELNHILTQKIITHSNSTSKVIPPHPIDALETQTIN